MSALKDLYSPAFYRDFARVMAQVRPGFDQSRFQTLIFDDTFAGKELKDRMRHTTRVLHQFMPAGFGEAVDVISALITCLRQDKLGENSFLFLFLPDYIETYGLEDVEKAIPAIELVTQFISCEFAVRPFLRLYFEPMMAQMQAWAHHPNHHVRRLASEGSRPRLPWGMAVPALKQDPSPILPILETLKNDPSEYVRRSVANNLNDISKEHPETVLAIARAWKDLSPETNALIKHGCRTLLKKGHESILAFYALDSTNIQVGQFRLLNSAVRIGDSLSFTFSVGNTSSQPLIVRLEYAVYYRLQNGQLSRKVFKISERLFAPDEQATIIRRQKFTPITTRRFYTGEHRIALIVNGKEADPLPFVLLQP
ncbi:DNA alkylation repair protein [Arsenicibacter rosenii]|uniref:DNA alkylation repair protein n=1 Tax=Arsenicibacter rosenii TaxID=1750698 RepID=A0A1S2VLG7_9BACT|nr:DNA alkylation repair protein [Arsenicibacter rosenii]OIN59604.1 DNA alkylation repair protein [Arsenicibacter rosenii]